jgi:hypothetical protein
MVCRRIMGDQPDDHAVAEHWLGRARTDVSAVAATVVAALLNASSPAESLLPIVRDERSARRRYWRKQCQKAPSVARSRG